MQPSPYGAGLAVNGDGAPAVMLEDDTESIEELPRISPLPSPDELGRLFDLSNGAGQPMFVGEGAVMGQGVGTTTAAATSGASAAWATPLSPGSFGRHSASQAVAIPSSRSGFGGLQAGAGEPEMGGLSLSPGGLSLSPGTSSLFDVSMDGGLGTSPTASSGRPFLALPSVESDDGIVDTFFGSEEAGSGGFGGGGGGGLQQQQRQQRFQQQQLALQQQQLRYQQQLQQQQYQLGSGSAPSYQSSIGFGSNIGASGLLGPLQPAALDLAGSAIPRPNDPKNNELWKRRMLHAEQQRYKAQVAAGHARTTFHAAGAGAGAAGAGMGMGGKGVGDAGTGGGHSAIVAYNPAAAAAQVKIKQEPRFTDTESKAREGAVGGGKGGAGRSRAGPVAAVGWDGKLPSSFNELTDNQLTYITQPDLRRLIDKAGLSKEEIQKVKAKRRKLKNRQSAKVAVGKKKIQFQGLAKSNKVLSATVDDLEKKNTQLKTQNLLQKQELYELEIARLQQLVSQMAGGGGGGAVAGVGLGAAGAASASASAGAGASSSAGGGSST